MKTKQLLPGAGLLAGAAMLFSAACSGTGATRHESRSIAAGDATTARVDVEMGAGRLDLAGGADSLLDADFTYNVDAWKPRVDYRVNGGQGVLTVRQPSGGKLKLWDLDTVENRWTLRLGDDLPMDLHVDLGAGRSELRLGGLPLAGLDINHGAGTAVIDLTGAWTRDLRARIEGGAGDLTLRLPRQVGVRVAVEQGIGTVSADGFMRQGSAWVNDAYGAFPVTLQIDLEHGAGRINLELGG